MMQIKENEAKKGHNNEKSAEFKSVDQEYHKVAYECKPLPASRDFSILYTDFKSVEISRFSIGHGDHFIPQELLVGNLARSCIHWWPCYFSWRSFEHNNFFHLGSEV